MTEILSLWRSPLDRVGLAQAEELRDRQPLCSIGAGEDFSAMTIYNYGFYLASSSDANAALKAMFTAMAPGPYTFGGLAFIPHQSFPMAPSSTGFSVPDQSNIIGSGGGGAWQSGVMPPPPPMPFYHFVIDFSGASTFLSCNSTTYTSGGKYFRSLAFKGVTPTNTAHDTCIYAVNDNCRAIRCTFTDIPTTFYAAGNECALEQCTIDYEKGKNSVTAVVIVGSRFMVLGPGDFQQHPRSEMGPENCTCLSIQGGANQTVIANTHISDWTIGVDFSQSGGSYNTEIRNCESQSYQSALNIQVASGNVVSGVKVTGCTLTKANYSAVSDPVILIDPGGGSLSDIVLYDCLELTRFRGEVVFGHQAA